MTGFAGSPVLSYTAYEINRRRPCPCRPSRTTGVKIIEATRTWFVPIPSHNLIREPGIPFNENAPAH